MQWVAALVLEKSTGNPSGESLLRLERRASNEYFALRC